MTHFSEIHRQEIERVVRQYQIAHEALTEKQMVEVILQALASGDLIKYVVAAPGDGQCCVYVPFAETERLKTRIKELEEEIAAYRDDSEEEGDEFFIL